MSELDKVEIKSIKKSKFNLFKLSKNIDFKFIYFIIIITTFIYLFNMVFNKPNDYDIVKYDKLTFKRFYGTNTALVVLSNGDLVTINISNGKRIERIVLLENKLIQAKLENQLKMELKNIKNDTIK